MEICYIVEVGDIVEAGDIVEVAIVEASVLAPAQTNNLNALEKQITFPPMYMLRRKVGCVFFCFQLGYRR